MGLFSRKPVVSEGETHRIAALWPRVEELTFRCLSEAGLSVEQIHAEEALYRAGEEPGNVYQITHMMISENLARAIRNGLRSTRIDPDGPASAMLADGPEAAVANLASSGNLLQAEALGDPLTRYMDEELPKMAAAVRRRLTT